MNRAKIPWQPVEKVESWQRRGEARPANGRINAARPDGWRRAAI
jgi:hypothetical protein